MINFIIKIYQSKQKSKLCILQNKRQNKFMNIISKLQNVYVNNFLAKLKHECDISIVVFFIITKSKKIKFCEVIVSCILLSLFLSILLFKIIKGEFTVRICL